MGKPGPSKIFAIKRESIRARVVPIHQGINNGFPESDVAALFLF
jgi:hypothetical protein